jgi:formate dehydrogenase major subunit
VTIDGRTTHQVGLPYHWGQRGLVTGGAANDLAHMALDPNVHIQEVKAFTCDIRPGRRPRGPQSVRFVEAVRRRAHEATAQAPRLEPEEGEQT